jgi:hypothetical protein
MAVAVLDALAARTELTDRFGPNGLLLYALEMRFGIEDIVNEATNCLTDDTRDKKCDALYIDRETGTAVIVQGWFCQTTRNHAPLNKASDLNTAVAWVLGGSHQSMGESLLAAAKELADALASGEIESIEIWYCHNVPESTDVSAELQKVAESAMGHLKIRYPNLEIPVRHLEVGIGRLSEWYQSIQNPILVSDELTVKVDGWFEEVGTDWTAVCASVPARWLTDLYEKYGDRLYSANVRGYMPSRRTAQNINFNMEQTARERPGYFWAFNNGITALVNDYDAPKSHRPDATLKLRGVAIVNGAQTTGALSRSRGPKLSEASVLTRFVRCENASTVDDIIRYNNSQNPIKPSDFRSTDRHQERLRQEFRAISDATYLGARRGGTQDRARRPSNLLASDTVAQALAAFHGDPGIAYHELRSIWERDEVYASFFSDFTSAPHIVYVYSLMATLQDAKAALLAKWRQGGDAALTEDEKDVLSFFRLRGSSFLLVSAVAACSEIHLARPVPDRFKLSFGSTVSPAVGKEYWYPTVEVSLPFVGQLRDAASGNLRRRNLVEEAINNFRSVVRSTSRANGPVFAEFRNRVVVAS